MLRAFLMQVLHNLATGVLVPLPCAQVACAQGFESRVCSATASSLAADPEAPPSVVGDPRTGARSWTT